ncbi:MAG: hypothetical protein FJY65_10895 [Calditrichaeota bacterium]|nr:hypothetical protein [Calditrichota bacterium]
MNIYILKNFTQREVYFGLAEEDSSKAVKSHKDNLLSPVGHWKWGVEKIQWGEVQKGLPAGAAAAFINALRKEPPEEGWAVVFGLDEVEARLATEEDEEG